MPLLNKRQRRHAADMEVSVFMRGDGWIGVVLQDGRELARFAAPDDEDAYALAMNALMSEAQERAEREAAATRPYGEDAMDRAVDDAWARREA